MKEKIKTESQNYHILKIRYEYVNFENTIKNSSIKKLRVEHSLTESLQLGWACEHALYTLPGAQAREAADQAMAG